MARSRNSRRGSRIGHWKCGCHLPKQVAVHLADKRRKAQGRIDDDPTPHDEAKRGDPYCDCHPKIR